jgi:hypothetical protein
MTTFPVLTVPELRAWARAQGLKGRGGGSPALATVQRKRAAVGPYWLWRCDDSVVCFFAGKRRTHKAESATARTIIWRRAS